MKVKSILIAAHNYPTPTDPVHTFLEQLVLALSRMDIKVTVIAPYHILQHYLRHTELHPRRRVIEVVDGVSVTVLQPRYFALSNRFKKFNLKQATKVVCKEASRLKEKPDICYGHFWHWAWSIHPYARRNNIPLFVNTSETPIVLQDIIPFEHLKGFIDYVSGVVCASSYCKDQSVARRLTVDNKCKVIPNAINNALFFKQDKVIIRKKHGYDESDFIVAYIGWFSSMKGSDRLSEAITKLNDKDIKSFFIGSPKGHGTANPTCEGILHIGRLPHNKIPEYLNMADIFVLPTLAEGCCNAIIEAMACGLPIVSSNLPFNRDVLNEKNSIMVDSMNVDEIATAIKTLKDDRNKRNKMAQSAIETAAGLTIDRRAVRIINFIESKL